MRINLGKGSLIACTVARTTASSSDWLIAGIQPSLTISKIILHPRRFQILQFVLAPQRLHHPSVWATIIIRTIALLSSSKSDNPLRTEPDFTQWDRVSSICWHSIATYWSRSSSSKLIRRGSMLVIPYFCLSRPPYNLQGYWVSVVVRFNEQGMIQVGQNFLCSFSERWSYCLISRIGLNHHFS